jgi:hypothetical protein
MKVTNINHVYCKPETEKEKKLIFDDLCSCLVDRGKFEGCAVYMPDAFYSKELKGYTEVSVKKFADMINDKIEPWRLEELEFEHREATKTWVLRVENEVDGWNQDYYVKYRENRVQLGGNYTTITKFSELQTLLRFLTLV